MPTPSYPLFDFLGDLNDVKLVPYELVYDHGWQIDFESLLRAMTRLQADGARCRALLVVHPNNPTGSFVKPHEVTELNRICAANEMAIIADEVFLDYLFGRSNPANLFGNHRGTDFYSERPVQDIGTPADEGGVDCHHRPRSRQAGGARQARGDCRHLPVDECSHSIGPPHYAGGAARHSSRKSYSEFARISPNSMRNWLTQNLCQRLAVEGGWYAVLRVPALGSDEELAIALLRNTGVLLHPGHFYNFPGDGYLVASLITPCAEFAKGISRILPFIAGR